jgi:AraC-like DNA-binding protein
VAVCSKPSGSIDVHRSLKSSNHQSAPEFVEIQGSAGHGVTTPCAKDNAYLVQLRLLGCPRCDYFLEGKHIKRPSQAAGLLEFHDLRREARADIQDPFHLLHLHLPNRLLGDIAYEAGLGSTGELHFKPGIGVHDPVAENLFQSIRPALARPEEASLLFVDHVTHALTLHVAQQYGALGAAKGKPSGGLAPWQKKRVMELMDASIKTDIPLALLALECGISVRHFSRAFRQSFGMPPHRYLLRKRIELAQRLLMVPTLPLLAVAVECGFANQSHFSRVFAAVTGIAPGQWRRLRVACP